MNRKQIIKNFRLSRQFNAYAVKHPNIFKNIPRDVCIIMSQKSDPEFTQKNLRIAEKIIKKERKMCFKAIKKRDKWILESI